MALESTQNGQWLLQVNDLRKHFPIHKGFLKREVGSIRAVDDVSFYINEGETLSGGRKRLRQDHDRAVYSPCS